MKTTALAVLAAFFCVSSGCAKVGEIPGTYEGNYAKGTETFDMRADGTFTQTFVRNGQVVYTNEGKWKLQEDGERIKFEPVICFSPSDDGQLEKYEKFNIGTGYWRSNIKTQIIFASDYSYWVIKK